MRAARGDQREGVLPPASRDVADAAVVHTERFGVIGRGEVPRAGTADAGGVGAGGGKGDDYVGVLEGGVGGCDGSVAGVGDAGRGCVAGDLEQ